MPLNPPDSEFLPFFQYDSKSGRFFARADGAAERQEIEKPVLAFDMEHIKTGWIRFSMDGNPPERMWDGSPTDRKQRLPRPQGDGWKRGFEVLTYSNAIIPGTQSKLALRSFSSNAFNVYNVMCGMYAEYEGGLAAHPNMLPVFACQGVRADTVRYRGEDGIMHETTVYEPIFELVQWVKKTAVPAFIEYQNSQVQILPPQSAKPQLEHHTAEHPTHTTSSMRPVATTAPMKTVQVTPQLQAAMAKQFPAKTQNFTEPPWDEDALDDNVPLKF